MSDIASGREPMFEARLRAGRRGLFAPDTLLVTWVSIGA
jgi:hypothetical protein